MVRVPCATRTWQSESALRRRLALASGRYLSVTGSPGFASRTLALLFAFLRASRS